MINSFYSWDYLRTFYSAEHSQQFLRKCYETFSDADKLSYQNSYAFIYYLEHGKKYFDQAETAPYELQPVLLFYGMVQLMKAGILTVDPNYPETTQVLAHGVSTRKRKKSQYSFLLDEVKVQKNGLLPHFSEKLFNLKQLEGEKYKMGALMQKVPELHKTFYYITNEKLAYEAQVSNEGIIISSKILDQLNISKDAFVNFLNDHLKYKIVSCDEQKTTLLLKIDRKLTSLSSSPFQFNLSSGVYSLPTKRELFSFFPELLAHYLLLYNLSMVCRYETEWWGELFHSYPTNDLPFITHFLKTTKHKVPYYISLILKKQLNRGVSS
ncbi:hypothetical protein BKP35_04625 [Anaerobacillus arseniciselenatis]|uniref:YaaC-like Protein n=1 Tax=Anaerobacillus arseniciselenatis TaxID=85682 RepID=A0A1S2LUS1_9BACI|nr:YaaC family protein [Anaerobacillus arseniciselenatis]OIJ16259.1 hypothetical protein BKP35_04625 [Anaerobacillus arseniciselenatis]